LSRVLFCFVSLLFHFLFFFSFALQGEVEIDDDDLSTLEVRVFSKMFMSELFYIHYLKHVWLLRVPPAISYSGNAT